MRLSYSSMLQPERGTELQLELCCSISAILLQRGAAPPAAAAPHILYWCRGGQLVSSLGPVTVSQPSCRGTSVCCSCSKSCKHTALALKFDLQGHAMGSILPQQCCHTRLLNADETSQ